MTGFISAQAHPRKRIRMSMALCSTLLLAGPMASQPAFAQEFDRRGATPSHVFQAVRNLIAEIGILREELGVYDYPPEAELQEDRAPVHAYVKTLEVLTKVSGIQRRMGVPAAPVGRVPFKEIVPGDVLGERRVDPR